MEECRIELIDYLRVIWKRKIFIIVWTLVCTVAAGAFSFMLPEVYKASVTFMLQGSTISRNLNVQDDPELFETYGKTYEQIIKNKSSMIQTIREFQLDKEPYGLDLEDIVKLISVEAVKQSRLLHLTVEFPNRRLSSDIANFLAGKAVECNKALSTVGSGEDRDFIKAQIDVAIIAMDAAESGLLEFTKNAQLAVLKKRLDILLSQKGVIEMGIFDAEVVISEKVEHLKKIEEEFKKSDRTISLSRKLIEDPLYQQSLAKHSKSKIEEMFNLSMDVEVVNPTYHHLEKKLVDVVSALSGLYAKRDFFKIEQANNRSELKDLQIERANKEIERDRLKIAYGLSVGTYKMLKNKFEVTNIQVASMSQDLKVIDPAVIPNNHFKPRKTRNVILAGIAGLITSFLLAFFIEYLGHVRERDGLA